MIPFNKPYYSGNEADFIGKVMETHMLTGDLEIMRRCEQFLENEYGFKKAFLANSCTMALEMAALLAGIKPGDEVIIPSYTYVSTANAFALRGARIVFADSSSAEPNVDAAGLESLITKNTKVIVPVHYAGVSCDMEKIMSLAHKHDLLVIEDAAQCIDSFCNGKALGSLGDIGCFSFHETKNIHCGEGGAIVINSESLLEKTEIIRNKGTNRSAFLKGQVNKYEWVDLGFSSIPSGIAAAFLYSQLEKLNTVQLQRKKIWEHYSTRLTGLKEFNVGLPEIPSYATNNAHLFYLVCRNTTERSELIKSLAQRKIQAVFHYQSLHSSPYYHGKHDGRLLPNADRYSDCLLRLPLFYSLEITEADMVCDAILEFYNRKINR